jgi:choline dehydrogenase-like flavoprotein
VSTVPQRGVTIEFMALTDNRWTKNHYGEKDWNIVTPPQPGLNGKECRLPRGRVLGGSSGTNGTICVRGVKQDYDDWGFPEWSGDEMFRAMRKVR